MIQTFIYPHSRRKQDYALFESALQKIEPSRRKGNAIAIRPLIHRDGDIMQIGLKIILCRGMGRDV